MIWREKFARQNLLAKIYAPKFARQFLTFAFASINVVVFDKFAEKIMKKIGNWINPGSVNWREKLARQKSCIS